MTEPYEQEFLEKRLARDAHRLLATVDTDALAARLKAELRRRRRRRRSLAGAATALLTAGLSLWSARERPASPERPVIARHRSSPAMTDAPGPRPVLPTRTAQNQARLADVARATAGRPAANERVAVSPADAADSPAAGPQVIGIPFIIEPAEGSGRRPVVGIYVPGVVQPLDAADLSPAEQQAVNRVLGIQNVSTDHSVL
jgi:hypothetical protein